MKRTLKRWLLSAIALGARPHQVAAVPALTYHSIDASGSPISFREELFRAQLSWLQEQDYRAVTASEAAKLLSQQPQGRRRSIALTFDDGFRSVWEAARPILADYGFVATVFCNPHYIGGKSRWARSPGIPELELCSWQQLRALVREGWEIGGHSMSHAALPALPDASKREEIGACRRILEQELGCEVTSFSYPYGEFDAQSVAIVRDVGYVSAWTMRPLVNHPGCDLLALGRFNCDRIRSDSPRAAALAVRIYLHGRYPHYAALTARRLRVRRPRRDR